LAGELPIVDFRLSIEKRFCDRELAICHRRFVNSDFAIGECHSTVDLRLEDLCSRFTFAN
jgi:hypothetical protein